LWKTLKIFSGTWAEIRKREDRDERGLRNGRRTSPLPQ
jgi:hypothetical protein